MSINEAPTSPYFAVSQLFETVQRIHSQEYEWHESRLIAAIYLYFAVSELFMWPIFAAPTGLPPAPVSMTVIYDRY